jgi:hypothetical protein
MLGDVWNWNTTLQLNRTIAIHDPRVQHISTQISYKVHFEFEIEVSHCLSNFILSFPNVSHQNMYYASRFIFSLRNHQRSIEACIWEKKTYFNDPENADKALYFESTRNGLELRDEALHYFIFEI